MDAASRDDGKSPSFNGAPNKSPERQKANPTSGSPNETRPSPADSTKKSEVNSWIWRPELASETADSDDKSLAEDAKKLLNLVTNLGTAERLEEAKKLAEAQSVEEVISTALTTKAASEITDIVAQATGVLSSEKTRRVLTAKGADLVVATEKLLSDKNTAEHLSKLAGSGLSTISDLAEKGIIQLKGKEVLKSAEKVLLEVAEGKGLSSEELKKWTQYMSSDSQQQSQLMNDPNMTAILGKANDLLSSPVAVEFLKKNKDSISSGAMKLIQSAESFLANKASQKFLKDWANSGVNAIRAATANKLYKINEGFKFYVRSEPTTSAKKKTGLIYRSGDVFTVSEVKKDPLGKQTYLKLADGTGWIFTDHPKPNDDRKLVSEVEMTVDKKKLTDEKGVNGKTGELVKAQESMKHRGHVLLDLTGKKLLGKSADEILSQGTRIMENKQTRDTFLAEIKDASVDFLLSYLPTLQVGIIDGVKDKIEYKLWDIDLSGFKVYSEHVAVAFDDQKMELLVTASKLSCQMKRLGWQYKQQNFPYLSGNGHADAFAADADFRFVVAIEFVTKEEAEKRKKEIEEREKKRAEKKRREEMQKNKMTPFKTAQTTLKLIDEKSEEGKEEMKTDSKTGMTPESQDSTSEEASKREEKKGGEGFDEKLVLQVTLKEKKLKINELTLVFDTGGGTSTWIYNKMASIFKESIRGYVESHINTALDDYSGILVDILNKYAQQYYPLLLHIVTAAKKGAEKAGKAKKKGAPADSTKGKEIESIDANTIEL